MEREGIYKEPEYGFDDKTLNDLFNEQPPLEAANRGQRFINFMLDHFVIAFIFLVLFTLMGGLITYFEGINGSSGLTSGQDLAILVFFLFCLSTHMNYYLFFEYFSGGKTIGKRVTGTKVVMKDGSAPSFKSIFIRTFCRYLPFEIFSFLGSVSEGWHDKLSNTKVVIDIPQKASEFV